MPVPALPAASASPGVVQGDQVGGIGDAGRWGQCRRPGDAAITAGHAAQSAVGNCQVGNGKTGDCFTKGNGYEGGFANGQCGVGDHNAGGWALAVYGIIVGIGSAGPSIAS